MPHAAVYGALEGGGILEGTQADSGARVAPSPPHAWRGERRRRGADGQESGTQAARGNRALACHARGAMLARCRRLPVAAIPENHPHHTQAPVPPSPSRPPSYAASATREQTYRYIYPMRVLGMGLGGVAAGSVLLEQQAPPAYWWILVATCFVWPHLAYLLARRSKERYRAEKRNLLIDSAIAGLWVPLMHFNLLPSLVLVTVTTFDKLSTGIKRLWLHSLPGLLGTAGLATLLTRPEPMLQSSHLVVLCTLPLIIVHTLASSIGSYRLIRTVSRQNRQLEELRRTDSQTGLYTRDHWQERADAALRDFRVRGEPAYLLMIDIDRFKFINDTLGHSAGDEVISAVGHVIRDCIRAHDSAGRYGGDEFAVVCADTQAGEARAIAERIRACVQDLRLPEQPDLRLTCSIGLAAAQARHDNLRAWMNDADAALYRAKNDGRNQVSGEASPPSVSSAVPSTI